MQNLFYPKSIAVIGASKNPQKLGHIICQNIIDSQYGGRLFLVNPKEDNILGQKVYSSVLEIKEYLEVVIIIIPAKSVKMEIENIVRQKESQKNTDFSNVIIITAGFGETGQEGKKLEAEILEICRKNKIRLVGPNCLGIINNDQKSEYKFNGSFAFTPRSTGNISLISQSGAIISSLVDKAEGRGFGFNKIISVGNKTDLEIADYLEYLLKDETTKVIAIYNEGFKNGQKLVKVIQKAKKPILMLKSGRSEVAKEAVTSHTGTIAGNTKVATMYLERANCVLLTNLEEFFNTIFLFSGYQRLNLL